MKVKRQKHVRKVLLFYKTTFGLAPPYNILIDGTFCKAALKFQVNIAEQLPKYLDAELKMKTTSCVLSECKAFGSLLYGPLKVLRQFEVEPCKHGGAGVPAARCLRRLAKKESRQYFIATQDPDLSDDIRSLPGVPLLFISHNAISLEAPSGASKEKLAELLDSSKNEFDRLKELKKKELGDEEQRKKRKRKGPKGPNPLSCKKKKKVAKGDDSNTTKTGNKRKRKRKKHGLKQTERTSAMAVS